MATETGTKATLHHRAMHELKELAIISAYLYITLGAVIMMKTAVLRTEGGVEFIPWGIAIVKAVVLGKFVLLGNMVHVGGRDISGPLIWPTLRRAFAFLVLLVVLTIIEEAVVGLVSRSVDRCFARRAVRRTAGGDAGRLPDHAAGADPVLCLPRAQRVARRRQARANVLHRAVASGSKELTRQQCCKRPAGRGADAEPDPTAYPPRRVDRGMLCRARCLSRRTGGRGRYLSRRSVLCSSSGWGGG